MLSDTAILVRRGEPLTTEVDGHTVMFDPSKGRYFSLAGVGGRIWELLEEPRSVADVCEVIGTEFHVAPADCRPDVIGFLDDLTGAGLVEVQS